MGQGRFWPTSPHNWYYLRVQDDSGSEIEYRSGLEQGRQPSQSLLFLWCAGGRLLPNPCNMYTHNVPTTLLVKDWSVCNELIAILIIWCSRASTSIHWAERSLECILIISCREYSPTSVHHISMFPKFLSFSTKYFRCFILMKLRNLVLRSLSWTSLSMVSLPSVARFHYLLQAVQANPKNTTPVFWKELVDLASFYFPNCGT